MTTLTTFYWQLQQILLKLKTNDPKPWMEKGWTQLSKQHKKINSGTTNFGGINTYSTLSDGYQITAVGEVPKATVKLIADSVQSSH